MPWRTYPLVAACLAAVALLGVDGSGHPRAGPGHLPELRRPKVERQRPVSGLYPTDLLLALPDEEAPPAPPALYPPGPVVFPSVLAVAPKSDLQSARPTSRPGPRRRARVRDTGATRARPAVAPYAGVGGHLVRIRQCESGGRYDAVSSSGTYKGAYQFDARTHRSVGGDGNAADDSPAEQDAAAARLYAQRGAQPWPTCGRR